MKNVDDITERCKNGQLPIGINTDGTPYCQEIAVRCGEPSEDSETFCLSIGKQLLPRQPYPS